MAKLGYQQSETPKPIVRKFGMGDYAGDITSTTTFKPIVLGPSGKWVKYYSRVVFSLYPLNAMLAQLLAVIMCLSVGLSVCPYVCHAPVLY